MSALNRRSFLQTGLAAASVAALESSASQVFASVNEKVNVAVMGAGRGAGLANAFARLSDSLVVAICETDEARGKKLADQIGEIQGKRPPVVSDFRTLLDKSDVDALAIATPDHWHAPATIMGCVAGKDVYVEKPAAHNIAEGRIAINAARKHKRIVQHGTNLRSAPHYKEAWKLIKDGVIGTPMVVKAINNQKRGRVAVAQDEPTPAGVNYDLWLGPAPERPFNRNHFHYAWHWRWEYGTGDIGNDGVHQIDLGRWALGLKAPKAVSCSGAKLGSKGDAQQTPDTMVVTWEYDDLLYVYEQRDFAPYQMQGHRNENDNIIYGDKGYMLIDRDGYRVFFRGNEAGPKFDKKYADSTPAHAQNFVDCIKSRKSENLIADIEEGHYSSLLVHVANISYRTGKRLQFDGEKEKFIGDGAQEANAMLGREYRKGYELPTV